MTGNFCSREFRRALSQFATGVTIITCQAPGGELIGITANSFTSVSLDPPLVLFNVARAAKSATFFRRAPCFGISVLADTQLELAALFAVGGGNKWLDTGYAFGSTGAPLIEGAMACFECRSRSIHEAGDHIIVIGEVVAMQVESGMKPLLFFGGKFCEVTDECPAELEAWTHQVITASSRVG